MRLIRLAYGVVQKHAREMSQSEMARLVGISVQTWNNAETGYNRLGVDAAMQIARKTGVTLDYIYLDERGLLPHALAMEIEKLEVQEADQATGLASASR